MKILLKLLILLLLIDTACQRSTPISLSPAFYYWKTTFALSPVERQYLDQTSCKKLYIKHLDIGIRPENGTIVPLAQLSVTDSAGLGGREIGSVIFIQQALFQGISKANSDDLVQKILTSIAALPFKVSEVQFDCDWTASSRAGYFEFLQKIKLGLPRNIVLSATIRLHQYKFPKQTGVPPVDRGMLMLYNTGDIDTEQTQNSIFDPIDAQVYTNGSIDTYPLSLDIALPLFSWVLVYREGHLFKIVRDFPKERLLQTDFFQPTGINTYEVVQSTYIQGHYLRPGDRLRVESISDQTLIQAATIAASIESKGRRHLAFFDLDTSVISKYPVPLLDSLCYIAGKKY